MPVPPKKVEDQALGRSCGGLSTKIHALVDALGNPLHFLLTPGQGHDLTGADALLPHMTANLLIADRAFDADSRVLQPLAAAGKSAVIPPRPNRVRPRAFDRELYKQRHLIEKTLPAVGSMLTSPTCLCRPCRLTGPAHTAATAGFSIQEGENLAREGLSAGGERIRTFGSAMRLHRGQRGRGVTPPDPSGEWRLLGPPPDNSIGMPRPATGRMTGAVDRPQFGRTRKTVAYLARN